MMERRKFKQNELIDVLEKVSKHLRLETKVYLIGGLGMVLHGLKASTKDVDLVFDTRPDLKNFISACKHEGMNDIVQKTEEYIQLGTQNILESKNGVRLDIFYKQVCNGLILSEDMKNRAQKSITFSNLSVYVMSNEDIFLFKSITIRDDDLEDMAALATTELDWNVIEIEARKLPRSKEWLPRLRERLMDLYDDHGVSSPLI